MEPVIELRFADLEAERPAGSGAADHFTVGLARQVVEEFTSPGDTVLDPFAGWGATLAACAELGREGIGVELLADRVDHICQRVAGSATVVQGDARLIGEIGLPQVRLCFTSPPYMTRNDHPQNPLTAYQSMDGEYDSYLGELSEVFEAVGRLLTPDGHLILNVADLTSAGVRTPLATDLTRALSGRLLLAERVDLHWDVYPPGIANDCLLVFKPLRAQRR